MIKKIALFFCAFIAIIAFISYVTMQRTTLSHTQKKDVLIVGTSADYPPYAFIDQHSNDILGFDIDITRAICEQLGKKMIIVDAPFSSLIFNLLSDSIDIIAAGISPSPRRCKAVLFSNPYYDNDPIIIVSKKENPPITNLQDLKNKQIAVNTGYTSDLFLSQLPYLNLIKLKSPAESFLALTTNSVDALAVAQSSLQTFLQKNTNHAYQFFTVPHSADTYALAIAKHNKKLKTEIDNALHVLRENGTLQKIKEKWNLA